MTSFNPFDATGHLRDDLDDTEVAKLAKPQRAALMKMVSAHNASVEWDQAVLDLERDLKDAVRKLRDAINTHTALVPKVDFYTNWKREIKGEEPTIAPELTTKIAAAERAVEAAQLHLEDVRNREAPAKAKRAALRRDFAASAKAWSLVDGAPKSVHELVKSNVAREQAEKMARVAQGLDPNPDNKPVSMIGNSVLDRVMGGAEPGTRRRRDVRS